MRGSRLRLQRAHGGVERREELVGDEHLAAGERAHQRRLAGVRVADERDAELIAPRGPALVVVALDRRELVFQLGDAVADLAAIELEADLAGARTPAAARRRADDSRRRGATYFSRAISTCSFASRLRAWRWKISTITPVRSSTSAPVARSRLRAWLGEIS